MRADDPLAACPVCEWRVPADSAAAADEIGVAISPARERPWPLESQEVDEVWVVGARCGRLHACPAASLPRDLAGRYVQP